MMASSGISRTHASQVLETLENAVATHPDLTLRIEKRTDTYCLMSGAFEVVEVSWRRSDCLLEVSDLATMYRRTRKHGPGAAFDHSPEYVTRVISESGVKVEVAIRVANAIEVFRQDLDTLRALGLV